MNPTEHEIVNWLKSNHYNEIANDLIDNLSIDAFIEKYGDKIKSIPGYIDLFTPNDTKLVDNAPLDMSEEEQNKYFSDENGDVNEYLKKLYQDRQTEQNIKNQEAEEVSNEYKNSNWYTSSPIGKLIGNDYARKAYAQGNKTKAILEELINKSALASDFSPFPFSLIGPTLRLGDQIYNEGLDNVSPILTGLDYGTSLLGPIKGVGKSAAKSGFDALKANAGVFGQLFDTKAGKALEKAAENSNAVNFGKEFTKVAESLGNGNWMKWAQGKSPKEIATKAYEVQSIMPEVSKEMFEFAKTGKAPSFVDEVGNVVNITSDFKRTPGYETDLLTGGNPYKAQKAIFDKSGNITAPAKRKMSKISNERLGKVASVKEPGTLTKAALTGLSASAKPLSKTLVQSYSNTSNPDFQIATEKEYDKEINDIIKSYERQWNAGFTPRGTGIEKEAYDIWYENKKKQQEQLEKQQELDSKKSKTSAYLSMFGGNEYNV